MKKIWHIGRLDLKLMVKDKAFFFWVLLFPLAFILIFGNLFGSSRTDTRASLTVLNQDRGKWGAYFIRKLESPKIELAVVNEPPAEYYRVLVIPPDFSTRIERKAAQEIQFLKDSEADLKAGAVADTKITQAIVKLLAELVMYGNRDMKAFFDTRNPYRDLVSVHTRLPKDTIAKIPSGFDHTLPGILVQFVMMMVLIYGGISVMEDRKHRVLARILYSSASFAELFGGKLLGRLLMGLLQSAILVAAGLLLFRLNLGNVWLSSLNIVVFAAAMAALSIFVGSVLRKEELIIGVSMLLANMFAGLGGCWWPIEIVPPAFRAAAMVSPAYWAMDTFHKIIFFGKGFAAVWPNLLVLLGFGAVSTALALRFFKVEE
ncbi:MAG: ABC transporter permease [Candidatus Aminicenantes bacterium]|nr:ABC transporter permease [Candidatus Aminicenantes bacterium]